MPLRISTEFVDHYKADKRWQTASKLHRQNKGQNRQSNGATTGFS